jgi:hypothetical protein
MFSNKRFLTLAAALSLAVFVGEGFISSAEAQRATCRVTRTSLRKTKLKLKGETTRLTSAKRSLSRFNSLDVKETAKFIKQEAVFTEQFRQLASELAKKLESASPGTGTWTPTVVTDPASLPVANAPVSATVVLGVDPFLLAVETAVAAGRTALTEGDSIGGVGVKVFLDQMAGDPAALVGDAKEKATALRASKLASANVTVNRILERKADAAAYALERDTENFRDAIKLNSLNNGKKGVNTIQAKVTALSNEKTRLENVLKAPPCV